MKHMVINLSPLSYSRDGVYASSSETREALFIIGIDDRPMLLRKMARFRSTDQVDDRLSTVEFSGRYLSSMVISFWNIRFRHARKIENLKYHAYP